MNGLPGRMIQLHVLQCHIFSKFLNFAKKIYIKQINVWLFFLYKQEILERTLQECTDLKYFYIDKLQMKTGNKRFSFQLNTSSHVSWMNKQFQYGEMMYRFTVSCETFCFAAVSLKDDRYAYMVVKCRDYKWLLGESW